jgi:hypothetical protein
VRTTVSSDSIVVSLIGVIVTVADSAPPGIVTNPDTPW